MTQLSACMNGNDAMRRCSAPWARGNEQQKEEKKLLVCLSLCECLRLCVNCSYRHNNSNNNNFEQQGWFNYNVAASHMPIPNVVIVTRCVIYYVSIFCVAHTHSLASCTRTHSSQFRVDFFFSLLSLPSLVPYRHSLFPVHVTHIWMMPYGVPYQLVSGDPSE